MNAFKTEKGSYTPEDFQRWSRDKVLEISPKFQRRSVWPTANKSYFIDTLLRGMTVPPIYLRNVEKEGDEEDGAIIREVVDGQQRIRSVLEYMNDGYKLSRVLGAVPWAQKRFSQLSVEQRKLIKNFTFSCETYRGITDQQVLEVFCRLNMNGIPLNAQELRNGKYFGLFKQSSYTLARDYLSFWRVHRVFTEQRITRMLEVELTSELLIAANVGMQDKKSSIGEYYATWEEVYPTQKRDERRFRETMDAIKETFRDDLLGPGEFHRPPMFYTLYCVVYHRLFGLPGISRTSPKTKLTLDDRDGLRDGVNRLSEVILQAKDPDNETPKKYSAFLQQSARQTDNIKPRGGRFNTLYDEAFS